MVTNNIEANFMEKMIINGRYLTRTQTGQERFASEIIFELDKITEKGEFELVCPMETIKIPELKNIKITKYGNSSKNLWEQIDLFHYSKKKKINTLNLTSTCPIKSPGVTAVHDLLQEVHPEWFRGIYGTFSKLWHKIIMNSIVKKGKAIITVSQFSKKEILEKRKFSKPILVLGNGWEHTEKIKPDFSIIEKKGLDNKDFFFSLGSTTPQKNFKWIYEVAKRNPNYLFVIGGGGSRLQKQSSFAEDNVLNVILLGRITDEEMKALMMKCKAYIYPSLHEGFGIPPLEALSCGAKLILSNSSCLPEIFKSSAFFFSPYDYNINLNEALQYKPTGAKEVLETHTWSKYANELLSFLRDNNYFL